MFANTHPLQLGWLHQAVERKTLVLTLYGKIQPFPWMNSQVPELNSYLSSFSILFFPQLTVRRAILWKGRKTNKQKDHKQNLLKADTWNCFMSMIFSYYSIYCYKPSVYATATAEVQHKSKASPHSRLWATSFSRSAWTVAIPWASLSRVWKTEFRRVTESASTESSGGIQVGPNIPLLMKTAAKECS